MTKSRFFTTSVGLRPYDAARWLAPPPRVRNVRRLAGGVSCLVQVGATVLAGATQEAIVDGRGSDSLLVFPDGTNGFDLHLDDRLSQPRTGFGIAAMGAAVRSRWVARPTRSRMVQLHLPPGSVPDVGSGARPLLFDGSFFQPDPRLRASLDAFCYDLDWEDASDLLLETHVALILAKLAGGRRDDRSPDGERHSAIARVVERIHDDLSRRPTLPEMARASGLSQSQFVRAFRRATGHAPHDYVERVRMQSAKTMLVSGGAPVSVVAAAVGIDDPSYFARVFRRHYGCTPGAIRRNSLHQGS